MTKIKLYRRRIYQFKGSEIFFQYNNCCVFVLVMEKYSSGFCASVSVLLRVCVSAGTPSVQPYWNGRPLEFSQEARFVEMCS